MIEQYLLEKVLDSAYEKLKMVLRGAATKLVATRDTLEEAIVHHLKSVNNWSERVSFDDLKKPKTTTDIFIHLDLFVVPRRSRLLDDETIPLTGMFEDGKNHIVLQGQPGAGKTTSMKYLCQTLFHDQTFYSNRFSFPLVIKLRELNNINRQFGASLIIDEIYNILGLRLNPSDETLLGNAVAERRALREKLVINVLEELNVLLILDGFDELTQITDREEALEDVKKLASHLDRSTLVLTTRTGEFFYNIDNTIQYELCPLSREQISRFATKWLNSESQATDFITKIYDSPFADTAIRPLTLAHICAIYERIGDIPEKPKFIYKKIIDLLLEEWDRQRSVKRSSKYAHFDVYRKAEFLSRLAYTLTVGLEKTVFSKEDLLLVYKRICKIYDLEEHEAQQVVTELESHTGLFLQSGYNQFEFAHKSLQEYLTAEYLVRLPSIPHYGEVLSKLPNEVAIAIANSSSPSDYLRELVIRWLGLNPSEYFLQTFLARLFLEKPVFDTDIEIALSVLKLYAIYVERNVIAGEPLGKYRVDRLICEFDKVMSLILRGDYFKSIQNLYELGQVFTTEDGDDLQAFYLKKGAIDPIHPPTLRFDVAETIYLRCSFLK